VVEIAVQKIDVLDTKGQGLARIRKLQLSGRPFEGRANSSDGPEWPADSSALSVRANARWAALWRTTLRSSSSVVQFAKIQTWFGRSVVYDPWNPQRSPDFGRDDPNLNAEQAEYLCGCLRPQ
jgi:hypothetical protein